MGLFGDIKKGINTLFGTETDANDLSIEEINTLAEIRREEGTRRSELENSLKVETPKRAVNKKEPKESVKGKKHEQER